LSDFSITPPIALGQLLMNDQIPVRMINRADAGGLTASFIAILTATLIGGLDVKAEMEYVAINDFIVASFDA
jgi:hypothetical protein